jgi:hypothetical protein
MSFPIQEDVARAYIDGRNAGRGDQREVDAALVTAEASQTWIAELLRADWTAKSNELLALEIVEHLAGQIRRQP